MLVILKFILFLLYTFKIYTLVIKYPDLKVLIIGIYTITFLIVVFGTLNTLLLISSIICILLLYFVIEIVLLNFKHSQSIKKDNESKSLTTDE